MSQEEGVVEAAPEVEESEEVEAEESSEEVAEESEESEVEEPVEGELSDSDSQELADEVEQAIEEGATQEEVQNLVEKFQIKVNGAEKEVELDWNNKEDIIRRLQLAEAAQDAMRTKAETEKLFEQELGRLKSNPWDVLQELGFDPDELAEDRIARQIEEMQKSPEQKEREQKDQELEDLRARLKAQEEEKEQIEFEQMQKQAEADLETEIEEAISAISELPKSAGVVKRVANAMAWAMDNGRPDIKAEEIVPIVEREYESEVNQLLENMPDKVLEKFMSKKVTERLRKQRLSKMPAKKKIVDTKKKETTKAKKKISLRDFAKNGFND